MFHCRPVSPYDDFILTSPASPDELGAYNAFGGTANWYSCKRYAVRVFGVPGNWAQQELDLETWAGRDSGDGKPQKVWRVMSLEDALVAGPLHYLSVNAITLEGADLVDWHKRGWACYYENRERKGAEPLQERYELFPGGCF